MDWADYGDDVIEAQEALNRPQFQHFLTDWIDALPDVAARLRAGGRVADIGCGTGWSSVWFARHFPAARVDGVDIDAGSIARARERAVAEGVADRVRFLMATDEAAADGRGQYDLVSIFEALHDMADPVSVLRGARDLLGPGGAVLVADERTDDAFNTAPDSIDRMFYGYSVLGCLPNGRIGETSVATGTVIRAETVEGYAREAGFASVTVLPTEHGQFRFYRLIRRAAPTANRRPREAVGPSKLVVDGPEGGTAGWPETSENCAILLQESTGTKSADAIVDAEGSHRTGLPIPCCTARSTWGFSIRPIHWATSRVGWKPAFGASQVGAGGSRIHVVRCDQRPTRSARRTRNRHPIWRSTSSLFADRDRRSFVDAPRVPLSIRYQWALQRYAREGRLRDVNVLDFHRIETVALFRNDPRPKYLTFHDDMAVIRDAHCDRVAVRAVALRGR